ncbi:hypothetical protein FE784_20030 [Paenibacillus hemerocallicola]|jgi:hypothetical protein|uniref:Aspartyl protease n=1 Tax=Paenibacillus hemerocallicola TaxID=1172614 RepID=A0A5C4T687_9BACL|nr:hypothetical protein [Paenibacillus hemerocallicola]TNJ64568.1 hypothetical protein FE784_20030 [Paenibacillus hemerocallicola]
MLIEYIDDLLQASMTILYRGHSLTINNLVVDTGAAHSLLSSDIVSELGIKFENGDKLVRSYYINGLIGLDILKNGNMIINLDRMEMYPSKSNPA